MVGHLGLVPGRTVPEQSLYDGVSHLLSAIHADSLRGKPWECQMAYPNIYNNINMLPSTHQALEARFPTQIAPRSLPHQ
jgi:hypothetical protein